MVVQTAAVDRARATATCLTCCLDSLHVSRQANDAHSAEDVIDLNKTQLKDPRHLGALAREECCNGCNVAPLTFAAASVVLALSMPRTTRPCAR